MENRLTFTKNYSEEFNDIYVLLSDLHIFSKIYERGKVWLLLERSLPDTQFSHIELNKLLTEVIEVKKLLDTLVKRIAICEFILSSKYVVSLKAYLEFISSEINLDNIDEITELKIFIQNETVRTNEFMLQNHQIASDIEIANELSSDLFKKSISYNPDYAINKLSAFRYDLFQQNNKLKIVENIENTITSLGDLRVVLETILKQQSNLKPTKNDQYSPEQEKYVSVKQHIEEQVYQIILLLKV